MGEMGPWEYKEMLDYWSTSNWGPYYMSQWPKEFEPPRTCSFCGGVHPDDAIKLVEQGWEVEATGKFYKRYINPPGTKAARDIYFKTGVFPGREYTDPTPPVKLYTMHFTAEQIERFNTLLKARE
jgi:hypothetical protein